MSEGLTIMENVAKEPHVVDVANFLNSMGANIRGAGTDVIKIRGVRSLHKTEYSIIPDQIEAGTFMFAAAATKGDVTVLNVIPKHLDATISKLVDIGCEVEEFDDAVRAGAALCIAGLAAEGITIVDDIVYIQRGYERFEEKLRGLGAMIERVSSEKEIQKFKLKVG